MKHACRRLLSLLFCLVFVVLSVSQDTTKAAIEGCATVETGRHVEGNCIWIDYATCCDGYCIQWSYAEYCSGG